MGCVIMKSLLAAAILVVASILSTPVASADPEWGGDCDCGGGYWGNGDGDGGYYPGYYGGWYPGKWVSGCVRGPYGYAQVCW